MFTSMAVIAEVDITDSAGLVELFKTAEEIWIMGTKVGGIERHVEIMLFDKPGHFFRFSQNIRIETDPVADIGHVFNRDCGILVM